MVKEGWRRIANIDREKFKKVRKEGVRWKIDGGERKEWNLHTKRLKRKHSIDKMEQEKD